jgi:hypothetical protein
MNDLSEPHVLISTRHGDLLDLTSHQRNLLLLRPLLRLDFNKLSHAGEDNSSLLESIDTNYLCLAALFYMMEGAAIQQGYTLAEVRDHLKDIAGAMKPSLSEGNRIRVAEIVTETLTNQSNRYAEYSESYFHAPSGETRYFNFRLIRFEADSEDIYRYTPTEDGYVVLMGMLDLEIEDYQILIEKMLQHLIENGRFDQALEIANRARVLSIEYRQQIRDYIRQAARSPGTVKWTSDINPRLTDARKHVRERQQVDHSMKESLTEKIRRLDSEGARGPLLKLHAQLEGANLQRMHLQTEIGAAGAQFLSGQASGFRARRRSGLPDLEDHILPALLNKPLKVIGDLAEDLLLSFYPAVPRKVFDLSSLFEILLERRNRYESTEEDDDGEITGFAETPKPFPEELMTKVHAWLDHKMSRDYTWHLGELLHLAETEGLSFMARKAVAYELYRAFADSESRYKHVHAVVDGEYQTSVVLGDDLRYEPVEVGENGND